MIKTDEPFLVDGKVKLRKTVDIEGNVGKIIRVGTMNDEDFDYDIHLRIIYNGEKREIIEI